MNPESFPLVGGALRFATDAEIRSVLRRSDRVIEWEGAGLTFLANNTECVIVRAGAFGGDTRVVHGGWKFFWLPRLDMAWQEIALVSGCYDRRLQHQMKRGMA